ncbi:uncharacterized protein LOC134460521 [Engraulis encrasicolus]|uniref:uncharacterized protein LOC134460521 n=1 Tax=Engraulis encrasicolus TaxID=184585 RepID=UPI002FD73E9B
MSVESQNRDLGQEKWRLKLWAAARQRLEPCDDDYEDDDDDAMLTGDGADALRAERQFLSPSLTLTLTNQSPLFSCRPAALERVEWTQNQSAVRAVFPQCGPDKQQSKTELWAAMAQSTRDSIKDILRTTLDNLGQKKLNRFKRLLHEYSQQMKSGAHVIPWGKLENTDEFETVNLIVQVYTEACSGRVVVNVLKKMKLNQMAEDLEKELNTETPVSASPEMYRPRKLMPDELEKPNAETSVSSSTETCRPRIQTDTELENKLNEDSAASSHPDTYRPSRMNQMALDSGRNQHAQINAHSI